MVSVDIRAAPTINGHHNGVNGVAAGRNDRHRNPYAPRASDFLNNISNFKIIESTLRGPLQTFLPLSFCFLSSVILFGL